MSARAAACQILCDHGRASGFHVVLARRDGSRRSALVTASHVLPTRPSIDAATVHFADKATRLDADAILARDEALDVMVVAFRARRPLPLPALPLCASKDVEVGAACIAYHFPRGVDAPRTSRGTISGETATSLCYTIKTEPGSSGAPVLNSAGEVIAVHTASNLLQAPDGTQVPFNEGAQVRFVRRALRRTGWRPA